MGPEGRISKMFIDGHEFDPSCSMPIIVDNSKLLGVDNAIEKINETMFSTTCKVEMSQRQYKKFKSLFKKVRIPRKTKKKLKKILLPYFYYSEELTNIFLMDIAKKRNL